MKTRSKIGPAKSGGSGISDETAALGRAVELAGRMPKVANGAVMQALWAILVKNSEPGEANRACTNYRKEIDAFSAYVNALQNGDDNHGVSAALAGRFQEAVWSDQQISGACASFVEKAYAIDEQLSGSSEINVEDARRLAEIASGPLALAFDSIIREIGALLAESSRDSDKQATATRKLTEETIENLKDLTVRIQLIAVNASVEAARVGQAGAGFGVIAHEITTLSQNAQSAVDQISKGLAQAAS